jgi:membrane fusion protein (multidrug efflux system)
VAGNVIDVAVRDYQHVRAGDLLLQIDPADYEVAVAQAEAGVAGAQAALANLDNQVALHRAVIAQAEAQLASAQAKALQAAQEQLRQQTLLQSTFGTRQRVEQAVADLASARAAEQAAEAAVRAQREQLNVLNGTRLQRQADLNGAEANLSGAKLRLIYTRIVAQFDGVVGQRQVQPGDYVSVGGNLISVVPLPQVYVIANYKETQLTYVEPGQLVDITVDTFPDSVLRGHVEQLSPAAGSQFALLPPDNATGNFTKVVQRIPIRIALEPGQSLLERLRPGMSVVTSIHTHHGGSHE